MATVSKIKVAGQEVQLYTSQVVIIGSGAAALNAALQLYDRGITDIMIVTERYGGGTSNNSGSDKQTYYKLSVEGGKGDSPLAMAKTLAQGCMHGDIAMIEATLSAQCFFNLVQAGVPFPFNKYGGYVGYKTDHDPAGRATSAGPRTSNQMFSALAKQVTARKIKVLDKQLAVSLLRVPALDKICGLVTVSRDTQLFSLFNTPSVIMATGGPGELYLRSVYPEGQLGSIALGLEAGAPAQNLSESQFGLASTKFRWNLSGTYQQVIPRYYSEDASGEHDFLAPVFGSTGKAAAAVFLKGYQWPFDPHKIKNSGSSLVDLLVYRETEELGRKVYLDFCQNIATDYKLEDCGEEVAAYLKNSGALQELPIERLRHMNEPAIKLYQDNNIDLSAEPLELAVCAQHTNGGLSGDIWWQSELGGLFPVGEVNGSHGVYRPGGSALNAGQVGSLRAAQYLAAHHFEPVCEEEFLKAAASDLKKFESRRNAFKENPGNGKAVRVLVQTLMSKYAGHIRRLEDVRAALGEAKTLLVKLSAGGAGEDLTTSFENYHLAFTSVAFLASIAEYLQAGGGSRGSALVLGRDGESLHSALPPEWKMKVENPNLRDSICEIRFSELDYKTRRVPVRAIPENPFWFENVWQDFRAGKIFAS